FGDALRYYREHMAERLQQYVPGRLPAMQLTAKEVVASMRQAGVEISQAAYSDIEQGLYLPKDPGGFLRAGVSCLGIEENSLELRTLMDHLAIDVLKQKLGADAAREYRQALLSVRERQFCPEGYAEGH